VEELDQVELVNQGIGDFHEEVRQAGRADHRGSSFCAVMNVRRVLTTARPADG
jgi:hypothetical protein